MQRIHKGGLCAPLVFTYPLVPHTSLERSFKNLEAIGTQMLEARVRHLVLAISRTQIEILEISHYPPVALWLDGCIPLLLEPRELGIWLTMPNAQVEIRCLHGVLEVRFLEE
jgi:hypothetical protein